MEAAERETTINWTDADQMAQVYTCQRPMITRLKRIRGAEREEVHHSPEGVWTGETWNVPLKAVFPRNPPRVASVPRGKPFAGKTMRPPA